MLEIKEDNGLVRITAGGKLVEADYDRFEPVFERIAGQDSGSLPMLIDLKPDFAGWDLAAAWRDLKFGVEHRKAFSRIAILGDKTWEEWGIALMNPLFPQADMKFFHRGSEAEAEAWARAA